MPQDSACIEVQYVEVAHRQPPQRYKQLLVPRKCSLRLITQAKTQVFKKPTHLVPSSYVRQSHYVTMSAFRFQFGNQ